MTQESASLQDEIDALRDVLIRLLREERDLSRLVAGAARLTTAIVAAERLQHQLDGGIEAEGRTQVN